MARDLDPTPSGARNRVGSLTPAFSSIKQLAKLSTVAGWTGSVVALAGTALGATLAYLFQRANVHRTEAFARDERLRRERIDAYAAFAGAITGLRQGVVSVWLIKQRVADSPEYFAAYTEADRLGAVANHARLRVQLVTGDPRINELAGIAFEPIKLIPKAADREQLVMHERRCLEVLNEFVSAARGELR